MREETISIITKEILSTTVIMIERTLEIEWSTINMIEPRVNLMFNLLNNL